MVRPLDATLLSLLVVYCVFPIVSHGAQGFLEPEFTQKCQGQNENTRCGPASSCSKDKGIIVDGLCDPLSGSVCCIPGSNEQCKAIGGVCMPHASCTETLGTPFPSKCPGTSQVVCCATIVPDRKLVKETEQVVQKAELDKPTWGSLVRNRISDVAEYLVANMTLPNIKEHTEDLCWPLTYNSTKKRTVTKVSWGASREGGKRCHAGVDLFTSTPGRVVSISRGIVVRIHRNFNMCSRGWGIPHKGNRSSTLSVMVHHPLIGRTVNYGEIDPSSVLIHEGMDLKKGQVIGTASYCGMLHFELYAGRHEQYDTWRPPAAAGTLPEFGNKCAVEYLGSKNKALLDPRPLLLSLEGRFCR